jgi:hypothetical protein
VSSPDRIVSASRAINPATLGIELLTRTPARELTYPLYTSDAERHFGELGQLRDPSRQWDLVPL